ncbi:MAG: diguanylate cyclase [Candidatus Hydrogenedentota bacterium]
MSELRVCVADDDRDAAEILIQGLEANGYSAFAAYTGEEALTVCQAGQADLLLLDVGLPDIDGYEVCRRLKENEATAGLPVIFVTVRGSDADVNHGLGIGAADYVVKPYNLPFVMVRIDAVMRMNPDPIFDTVYTDTLTGLRNRRYLLERLQEEVAKAHRFDTPVSCVLVDIDEFTPVDDDFGVAPLDDLLVEVAMALRNASRNYDVLARYDSAIFATVLPHSQLEQALAYARKVREELDGITFNDPNFPTQAGVSIGVVTCRNGKADNAEHLFGEAMRNLLRAKSLPGERIAFYDLNA